MHCTLLNSTERDTDTYCTQLYSTELNGDTDTHCTVLHYDLNLFYFFIFLLNQIYLIYRTRLINLTKFSSPLHAKLNDLNDLQLFLRMSMDCFLDYRNCLQIINIVMY